MEIPSTASLHPMKSKRLTSAMQLLFASPRNRQKTFRSPWLRTATLQGRGIVNSQPEDPQHLTMGSQADRVSAQPLLHQSYSMTSGNDTNRTQAAESSLQELLLEKLNFTHGVSVPSSSSTCSPAWLLSTASRKR